MPHEIFFVAVFDVYICLHLIYSLHLILLILETDRLKIRHVTNLILISDNLSKTLTGRLSSIKTYQHFNFRMRSVYGWLLVLRPIVSLGT